MTSTFYKMGTQRLLAEQGVLVMILGRAAFAVGSPAAQPNRKRSRYMLVLVACTVG